MAVLCPFFHEALGQLSLYLEEARLKKGGWQKGEGWVSPFFCSELKKFVLFSFFVIGQAFLGG